MIGERNGLARGEGRADLPGSVWRSRYLRVSNLRPAKIRSAGRRRWFEHRLLAMPVTSAGSPVHLGTAYGGWIVPAAVIRPGWMCYSIGAGGDVSFDAELIRLFDVRVRSFEPVQYFVDLVAAEMRDEPRFSVHRLAIAERDGPIRMQHTHHPGARALSAAGLFETNSWYEFPGRSLPSLMAEFGDERIDLLKMDTEGTEYELLPTLDLPALGIKVLAVCLHHNGSVRQARKLIACLGSAGYEAVAVKPAVKITFAHHAVLDPHRLRMGSPSPRRNLSGGPPVPSAPAGSVRGPSTGWAEPPRSVGADSR